MSAWFRKRMGTQGTGYGIASWQGVVASIVFIGIVTGIAVTAVMVGKSYDIRAITALAIALIALAIAIFVALIIARSDRS